MITRITIGKTYVFRGKYVKATQLKKGVRNWTPDRVIVKDLSGEEHTHMASRFREEANDA